MSATAQALRRAQELARATPVHVVAKQPAATAVKIEIPASLKDCPPHLFNSVSLEKLVKQRQYFTQFPDWCCPPTEGRHPHLHFDVIRPIPPGENGNTTDKVVDVPLPPMMLNRFPFYLIGASESVCDITMVHPSISRVHLAVVYHQRGAVCICDMNSSNGVFLNDQKIVKGTYVPVSEGDRIRLGATSRILIVRLGEESKSNDDTNNNNMNNQQEPRQVANNDAQKSEAIHHEGERRRDRQDDSIQQQQQQKPEEVTSATNQQEENNQSTLVKEFPKVHLAHLLIKHKDLEKNKSAAPRNKGETITRSLNEAIELARAVRAQLATSPENGIVKSTNNKNSRFILNNQKIFEAAVEKFSECGTAKRGGDMGVVEKGSLGNLPEFESAALRLEPLEISSDVVVTHLGVHILFRVPDEDVDN